MIDQEKIEFQESKWIIPVKRDYKIVISCFSLLVAASYLLYTMIWVLLNRNMDILGTALFIGVGPVIIFLVYKVIVNLLWSYTGKEIIQFYNNTILLKKEIFGIGRDRKFYISQIANINLLPFKETKWSSVPLEFKDKCSICFECVGKKIYFGYNLDESNSNELFIKFKKICNNNTNAA